MRAFGQALQRVGQGLMVVGAIGLFVSAVVGTLIADAFILYGLLSRSSSSNNDNSFFTGMLWGYILGSMMGNHHHCDSRSSTMSPAAGIAVIMVVGAVMSVIGIVLALHYAMPFVALLIGVLWLGSGATFLIGLGMDLAGQGIVKSVDRDVARAHQPHLRFVPEPQQMRDFSDLPAVQMTRGNPPPEPAYYGGQPVVGRIVSLQPANGKQHNYYPSN
ncbi:MAG: hypothetical protein NTW08_02550 [Gammaproteobacteria bacterium]|nr:hypothetical protein [Gammaproteobacteria bacterium]